MVQNDKVQPGKSNNIHFPTMIAIAALVWILANLSHETLGYAGYEYS
jgi:hypothetical protein